MSPVCCHGGPDELRFPRVSGDEPLDEEYTISLDEFSPRERG